MKNLDLVWWTDPSKHFCIEFGELAISVQNFCFQFELGLQLWSTGDKLILRSEKFS